MKVNTQINTTSTAVEIFKTNVTHNQLANKIVADLKHLYPEYRINFDLEDCDKVLRIESYTGIDILGILNYGSLNSLEINLIDY
ncbi:hypothetical protein ACSV4D_10120 [Flavobacterium sp. ARAG 55.4]|uniref:hypothetical protein n=1 Tax=Flavobacterium sp. ARAG 55.4 TaxID=3451357 RepID=UPI003F47E4D3